MTYDSKKTGLFSSLMQIGVLSVLRKPLVSTILLFLAGALFAAIVMMGYPDSARDGEDIPVIMANSKAAKTLPEMRGGMDIPNRDSTVFDVMRGDDAATRPVVENLLEQSSEAQLVDISEVTAIEESSNNSFTTIEEIPYESAPEATFDSTPQLALNTQPVIAPAQDLLDKPVSTPAPIIYTPEEQVAAPAPRKVVPKPAQVVVESAPAPAPVYVKPKAAPKNILTEDAPSETVDYVRSVLSDDTSASTTITSGAYYVQLASLKSESAARTEWANLRKKYGALSGVSYRVKRVDLGAKGVYYRIQAGSMSKASATSVCSAIKAKSGGCFVTK